MKSVGNMGGTIFNINTPIINFKCEKGSVVSIEILKNEKSLLPVEFWMKSPKTALLEFLTDQVTPETRIGIDEELTKTPVQYYDVERLLRYSHGYSVDATFWIRQDNDVRCWEGTELEGVGIEPINSFFELDLIKRLPDTSVLIKGLL